MEEERRSPHKRLLYTWKDWVGGDARCSWGILPVILMAGQPNPKHSFLPCSDPHDCYPLFFRSTSIFESTATVPSKQPHYLAAILVRQIITVIKFHPPSCRTFILNMHFTATKKCRTNVKRELTMPVASPDIFRR